MKGPSSSPFVSPGPTSAADASGPLEMNDVGGSETSLFPGNGDEIRKRGILALFSLKRREKGENKIMINIINKIIISNKILKISIRNEESIDDLQNCSSAILSMLGSY